jgi:acyl carrier protein
MTTHEALEKALRKIIPGGDTVELDRMTPLLDKGYIDSTGILDLILVLEEEFGIEIGDEEVIPDNFESIDRIAAFVDSKRRS